MAAQEDPDLVYQPDYDPGEETKDPLLQQCRPTTIDHDFCPFNTFTIEDAKTYPPYTSIPQDSLQRQEFNDWLSEFPVVVFKKGMVLIHAGNFAEAKSCWWNKYYVGLRSYGGGWFNYKTDFGGPDFPIKLTYILQTDIPLLFIPNFYRQRYRQRNLDYFSPHQLYRFDRPDYISKMFDSGYSGSHIIQGVKNWVRKGYPPFENGYYADSFSRRLSDLGFNGYASCDECELFISHSAMIATHCLTKPIRIQLSKKYEDEVGKFRDIVNSCSENNIELSIAEGKKRTTKVEKDSNQMKIDLANQYAKEGNLEAIVSLENETGILPTVYGANLAADRGHLDVLEWLVTKTPPGKGQSPAPILPDILGINALIDQGHLGILKLLAHQSYSLLPDVDGANTAAYKGHLDILEWLAQQNPPILPDVEGANNAADRGHLEVLEWLAAKNPPILPNVRGANFAFSSGKSEVLEWLANRNPPILPIVVPL